MNANKKTGVFMIIAITGGSGSGKSFVSGIFAEKGFRIVDADAIAKEIMNTDKHLIEKIKITFGEEFVDSNGAVDRRALGRLVFADSEKRMLLNSITHPAIITEIKKQALSGGNTVIDIPLLKDSGVEEICDLKIAVVSDRELRLQRIMIRDGIDRETAENRISSQLTDEEYIGITDEAVVNDGNRERVICQINEILKRYCY